MLTILQKQVKQGSMDSPGVLERQKDVRHFYSLGLCLCESLLSGLSLVVIKDKEIFAGWPKLDIKEIVQSLCLAHRYSFMTAKEKT